MKASSFKLEFQTSQKTNFATPIIVSKILAKLQDKKYELCEVTDKRITFKWSILRFVWNFKAPYILDGGDFEITKSEQGTIVVLNYFINTLSYLLIFFALGIFLVIQGEYFAILFFGIFFLIATVFQYNTTKNVGKELLNDMLIEE